MADVRAAEQLALRVLERWCLLGDEPMEGEQWDAICAMAGVAPVLFAQMVCGVTQRMSPEEKIARARECAKERSQNVERWKKRG